MPLPEYAPTRVNPLFTHRQAVASTVRWLDWTILPTEPTFLRVLAALAKAI